MEGLPILQIEAPVAHDEHVEVEVSIPRRVEGLPIHPYRISTNKSCLEVSIPRRVEGLPILSTFMGSAIQSLGMRPVSIPRRVEGLPILIRSDN